LVPPPPPPGIPQGYPQDSPPGFPVRIRDHQAILMTATVARYPGDAHALPRCGETSMWGGSRLSVRNTFIDVMSECGSSQPDGKRKGGAASVSAINEGGVARLQPMLDARASERIVDEDDGQSSVDSGPSPSCQMHCIECASEDPNGWGKPDRDF
jgi:hypothetical protein